MTNAKSSSWLRAFLVAACMHCLLLAGTHAAESANPAQAKPPAQQQDAIAPHNAVAFWREVRSGEPGVTTVRGTETGVLVSPDGNTWRQIRNGPITVYGGFLLLFFAIAIGLFHHLKGMYLLKEKPTGKTIIRFSNWERGVHWLVAISFICLALTGLNMLFGKYFLMPLMGHVLFSWLAGLGKFIHNLLGFVFTAGVVLMFGTFYRDNFWHPSDAEWIAKGGGLATHEHVPSGRFNFGEKVWFWLGVCLLGLIMIASGISLIFPNLYETRHAMQTLEVIHAAAAILLFAMSLGHIYIGTIGVEGAYQSMREGVVDEVWAKEHHELWYIEQKSGNKRSD